MSLSTEVAANRTEKPAWNGPRGHWLTACLTRFQRDPLNFYRETWQTYGDYARIRAIAGVHVYLLSAPLAVEHVLYKQHKNYRKPDVFNKPVSHLAGKGILTSEGDFWLKQRRLVQPAFLKPQMAGLSAEVVSAVNETLVDWEHSRVGQAFDVVPEMMRLALKIVSRALFGADIGPDAEVFSHAMRVTFGYINEKMNKPFVPPLWVPTKLNREFRHQKQLLDGVVLRIIETRRRTLAEGDRSPPRDVLGMLLAAQDETTGVGMSDQQLKDEVLTLLIAGHETIGAALSWTWYLLGQHPEIQESLCDEVTGQLHGGTPTLADLPRIPLAKAVFEESMRLYPPAWGMPRETLAADEILGHPIPPKATVILSQWITHRHPDYWSEPDRFQPERFLNHEPLRSAYFPFGGGPRICIGNTFAMIEGPLILAALAQRFQFKLVPHHEVIPDPTFTLRPKTGVQVVLSRRPGAAS